MEDALKWYAAQDITLGGDFDKFQRVIVFSTFRINNTRGVKY